MSKVVLFAAVLVLAAGIAVAGVIDPSLSEMYHGDGTADLNAPAGPTARPGLCYFACPQGDTDSFGLQGHSFEFTVLDVLAQPIPDIPRTDFWLIDGLAKATWPLILCAGAACVDADFATDNNGQTVIRDDSYKVSGHTDFVKGVVQGFTLNQAATAVHVRSVDIDGGGTPQKTVGLVDLAIFSASFPAPNTADPKYQTWADFDCSDSIVLVDLALFAFHFGPPGHSCQ